MQPSHGDKSWPKNTPAELDAKERERRQGKEKIGRTEAMDELITQGGEARMKEERAAEDTKPT